MDPLSITASALTVLSALESTFYLIRSYRGAPSQLEALNNEVADVTATVKEVARVFKSSPNRVDPGNDRTSHLTVALSNVREKAAELEALLRSCVASPNSTSGEDRVSRISWLKVRSKVQSLQIELRDARLSLSIALASVTASSSLRIELDIQDIFLITKEIRANQQLLEDKLNQGREQDRLAQDQFGAQMLAQLAAFLSHQRQTEHYPTGDQTKPKALVDSSRKILQSNGHGGSVEEVHNSLGSPVHRSVKPNPGMDEFAHWSSIGVRADVRDLFECSKNCKCSCHIRRRFNTPRLLDGILGTLFIGYSGSPLAIQKCDQGSCRGRRNSSASVVYRFPRWFIMSRIIQLKTKVTAMYGPEVSLRFNRVVNGKALVFHYATIGDVDQMKQLFERGIASPSDVRYDSGWTPFHYAIQNSQVEVCRLLLQAGGDPYMETEAPTTAIDYAGAKILGDSVQDAAIIINLRELFFDTQFFEHGKFSDLHKIILNFRPGNIVEELQKSTATLDAIDSTGRSPLSWAAQRGESEAVMALLEYGADPNNNDKTNMTPLHYAAQANTPKCLLLLIKCGARITQQIRGWTSLHYACSFHDDLDYVKPLLDHGADINTRTYVGKTALSLAVLRNHLECVAFLVGISADLDVLDNDGQSPLALSIKFRRCEAMKFLLRAGATHKLLSEEDDTLLHLVAQFPDLEIISSLSYADFGGDVDVDARNADGLTALECIQMQNSDPEIALAFQRLIMRVSGFTGDNVSKDVSETGAQHGWESDSSTEIYEDAVG